MVHDIPDKIFFIAGDFAATIQDTFDKAGKVDSVDMDIVSTCIYK